MNEILTFSVLLKKELFRPLNLLLTLVIGAIINYFTGDNIFHSIVPFLIPLIVQSISKASVNYGNRLNDLLLKLPSKRNDPVFISDLDGKVIASIGKTKELFERKNIDNLEILFGQEGRSKILDRCSSLEEVTEFCVDVYSSVLETYFEVQVKCNPEHNYNLYWCNNINEQKKLMRILAASKMFGNQLFENIDELAEKNNGFERVASFILDQGYRGIFITEKDVNDDFFGTIYKKGNQKITSSETIFISKESNAPILNSLRENRISYSSKGKGESQKDFEKLHPFDKRVKEFLTFEIKNYVNFYEGGLSVIAFNKEGEIMPSDLLMIEDLISKTRAINYLIDSNLALKSSKGNLQELNLELSENIEGIKIKEEQLQSLNKELNTFFYTTSHDLKSPIVNIEQLLLLSKLENNAPSEHYSILINNELTKMTRMLDMLNLVSSLDWKNHRVQKIDINVLILEILKEFESMNLEENFNINIDLDLPSSFSAVRRLLKIVLRELVYNAYVFRDHSKADCYCNLSIYEKGGRCYIQVEDNGVGMEDEILEKSRNMFFRGSNLSKGSGLGLYAVNRVIQFLGGEIEIASKINLGSKIQICIEAQGEEESKIAA